MCIKTYNKKRPGYYISLTNITKKLNTAPKTAFTVHYLTIQNTSTSIDRIYGCTKNFQ